MVPGLFLLVNLTKAKVKPDNIPAISGKGSWGMNKFPFFVWVKEAFFDA
jgi:hypothetical protein